MVDQIWQLERGDGPLVATAIHDGHALRDEVSQHIALAEPERLREEDPFTGIWAGVAPTRVVGLRSRFEVDLNRPRAKAVYRIPGDAWGLSVWNENPPADMFQRSLKEYDAFYLAMRQLFLELSAQYGRLVVFDLHTYNHRRDGPDGRPADPRGNPQVNVGTGTMDRGRWAPVVETFIESLHEFDFPGGKLDVRENVKFFGGNWPAWIHENFTDSVVVLSIEFKKFFMDEWTGDGNREVVEAVAESLQFTIPAVLDSLRRV